jgi:hypothetical protein
MTLSTLKSIIVSTLLLIGLYLGISSILAIPLIDEDKTKTKEISIDLKTELNNIKTTFVSHTSVLKYDTLTLQRFEEVHNIIGYKNNALSLQTNLSNKLFNRTNILENQIDVIFYGFFNKDLVGLNAKKKYKTQLLQEYKTLCSIAESKLFSDVMGSRLNVLKLHGVALYDTSLNHEKSKAEFKVLIEMLNHGPEFPDTTGSVESGNPFLKFFFLSNTVVKDESQTLAVILGLIGFGLLGAVIGTFSRVSTEPDISQRVIIIQSLFSTIIKSFSASVLSYLSIKGGLSIVSDNNDTNPNAYFILFVCFIGSVFSEEIWQWAKKKILPSG